jgi:hypothetical protein
MGGSVGEAGDGAVWIGSAAPGGTPTGDDALPADEPPLGTGGRTTGAVDVGGRKGTSIASSRPLSMVAVPAVIAARVGSDANATSSATTRTYLRVGPVKPSAR